MEQSLNGLRSAGTYEALEGEQELVFGHITSKREARNRNGDQQ
jgi:hypothetical protein